MKKQVILIHGGDTFNTDEAWLAYLKAKDFDFDRIANTHQYWHQSLRSELGDDYQVALPQMPNKQNSKYAEWKIWFEKMFPFFNETVVLIGHSLGGIFLAKYLSENEFPKKVLATFLVAAPFYDKVSGYPLGSFSFNTDLSKFEKQGAKIFLYHSEDDPIVPFADYKEYAAVLPSAIGRVFTDRGHFNQESLSEIIEDIKSIN